MISTLDRRPAASVAVNVINAFRIGRLEDFHFDIDIAPKYGVDPWVGDALYQLVLRFTK